MQALIKEVKSLKRKTPNQVVLVVIPQAMFADQPKNVLPLLKAHANKVIGEGDTVTEDFKADRIYYANPNKSFSGNTGYLQTVLATSGRLIILSVDQQVEAPATEETELQSVAA